VAVATVAEAAMVVRADFSRAGASVRVGARQVGQAAGAEMGAAFSSRLQETVGRARSGIVRSISGITAAVTGASVTGMVAFGLKTAASMEQAQIGFETFLGSAKKAQTFLAGLQRFAAATPFELPGLIEASRTLLGVGVAAKDVIPTLQAYGDAAGALGIQQDAFQRIMIAVSQSMSAGKIKLGDMNQLMNNGLPIWKLMSEAMHKPVPALQDMISHGKLLSKDVLPALQRQMEKDYGGAMAKQSQTLAGVWSTLKDTVAIGLGNAIKPLVPLLTDLVPKAAQAASNGLAAVSRTIAALITGFREGKTSAGGYIGTVQNVAATISRVVATLTGGRVAGAAADPFVRAAAVVRQKAIEIGQGVERTVGQIVAAYHKVEPAIASVVGWFNQHRAVAQVLATVILGFVAVVKVYETAMAISMVTMRGWAFAANAAKVAQGGWTAIQWLAVAPVHAHNAAMIISRSTTATWVGVKYLELSAWVRSTAATVTATAVTLANRGAVLAVTAAQRVSTAATIAWAAVTGGAATALRIARTAMLGLNMAMRANPIGAVITILALLTAAVIYAYKHSETFRKIVQGAWHGIQVAASAVWGWMSTVLWPSLHRSIDQVSGFFRGFGHVVATVFRGWQTVIATEWRIVSGTFNAIRNVITNTLPNAFRNGVAAIGRFWEGLRAKARAPVSFVVKTVINPFLAGFKRVAGAFGVKTPDPIGGFAEGGRIPGAPSSRDNRIGWLRNGAGKVISNIQVATGEFIVNARDTMRALPLLHWINDGMRGGPAEVARRLGRRPVDKMGDGSEGWAFAGGGLVGWVKDIWGAMSNPAKLIKAPFEAVLNRIPGAGMIKDVLVGMGKKLIGGFTSWLGGTSGGVSGGGNVLAAQHFVRAQAGKPYVWASAGPGGFDCSGIVSAVYNVLKGKNPYSHTFSTEGLPGSWFQEGVRVGPLVAGWAHPGQRGASANVGHTAGMIGGLPFSSTGSRGVQVGPAADKVQDFAHIGAARANGGLVELHKVGQVARADFGAVTLAPGSNLVYNGLGRPEPLETAGPRTPARMHPDDIAALADAIGGVIGSALTSTVGVTRLASRKTGARGR
jgi:tape measure domain-containing protein